MGKQKVELIETRDGSSSLLLPDLHETYHSTHGAITESKYVFLEKGLKYFLSLNPAVKTVRILEIGFGTGLNVWLTALENFEAEELVIQYTTLEKYPLSMEVIEKLNYPALHDHKKSKETFQKLHQVGWEIEQLIHPKFTLLKQEIDIEIFEAQPAFFDLIYFDAFAPSKQPEMWGLPILQKMNLLLSIGGILVTYCAQGQFKRDLKAAGFDIEALAGPPGKKEMTRGIKV